MIDIIRESDTDELTERVIHELSVALGGATDGGVFLLLSGGSVLEILKRMRIPRIVAPHITIGMIDERFSLDPRVNNFLQLQQTSFFEDAILSGCAYIDSTPDEHESLSEFLVRLSLAWNLWRDVHPKGKIIVVLGVGADGHTAGVMPFPGDPAQFEKLFIGNSPLLVAYDASLKPPYAKRMTASFHFLTHYVDNAFVFLAGESKRNALQAILSDTGELCDTPARILRVMKDVRVFTDIT